MGQREEIINTDLRRSWPKARRILVYEGGFGLLSDHFGVTSVYFGSLWVHFGGLGENPR